MSAFAGRASEIGLEPAALDPAQVLAGDPRVAERALSVSGDGRRETGVWEMTPGTTTDVEAEETFVVVSGRAEVEVEDGPTLRLEPGVVGGFAGGERTTWRVEETLRKVYVVTLA